MKVLWLTGLSGAGKSTLAEGAAARLRAAGRQVLIVDGDRLRGGLSAGLGFSAEDRQENVRRASEVARLAYDQGMIVLCALISPFTEDRDRARALFPAGDFLEVYLDCPLEECQRRDPKGLYARNPANLTGVSSPYQPPPSPDLRLKSAELSVEETIDRLLALLD